MTGRQMAPADEIVAEYVRASMRVDPPPSLVAEVMRAATATAQERRGWQSLFGPYTPAIVAVAAAALVLAVGTLIVAPRNVGPAVPTSEPTATPAPTLTPENARVLTEPGDVIRIPAFDTQGQFGTITIERGDERAGYDGYMPMQGVFFTEIFFVELRVTYDPTRPADDAYGNVDFGYALDVDGDGLDADDPRTQWLGVDVDGRPLTTGPSPLLPSVSRGDDPIDGWLVVEIPANDADQVIYLVQLGADDPETGNREPVASALLRDPGDPVGVTTVDPGTGPSGAVPTGAPRPSFRVLPTPMPSPRTTFEPAEDPVADALFEETQTCTNPDFGLIVTFPASWYANDEATEFTPVCSMFGPDPIDMSVFDGQFVTAELPPIVIRLAPEARLGIEEPVLERIPVGNRVAWRVSYTEDQSSYATTYLIPESDDPYGPFISIEVVEQGYAARESLAAIAERMLLLLELED